MALVGVPVLSMPNMARLNHSMGPGYETRGGKESKLNHENDEGNNHEDRGLKVPRYLGT